MPEILYHECTDPRCECHIGPKDAAAVERARIRQLALDEAKIYREATTTARGGAQRILFAAAGILEDFAALLEDRPGDG